MIKKDPVEEVAEEMLAWLPLDVSLSVLVVTSVAVSGYQQPLMA